MEMTPAIQRACAYIKTNLDKGEWRPGERLPPVRTLALHAGVSFSVMIKAVARLKADGLINGVERGRIRAGKEPIVNEPHIEQNSSARQMKRTALEKDILSGVFAHQIRLPSFKELQSRYGTGFRTMRKILQAMVSDGALQLREKAYTFPNARTRSASRRAVFIVYRFQKSPLSALNQGQYDILDQLERECIRRNLKLEVVSIDFYDPVATRRALAGTAINDPALGYILDLYWYPGEVFRRSHFDLLTRLSALGRPVTILDEAGAFTLPLPYSSNALFQVFRIEGKMAGARVARYLLGMGHQSIAYISSDHANEWSRQRLSGIIEQYSKAGCEDGVHQAVSEEWVQHLLVLLEMSGFDEKLLRKVIAEGRTKSQAEDQYEMLMQFRQNPPPPLTEKDKALFKEGFDGIANLARQPNLSPEIFGKTVSTILYDAGITLSAISNRPLFQQALSERSITAWICASDRTAMMALTFLKKQKVPVPAELSVVGFDNSPADALEQRLTTFDFNAAGFAYRMLEYIARPPKTRGPYHHSAVEVEGNIMQRDTVGPPKASRREASTQIRPARR
jgi:DNA-binding LacI/PurR family transcriptional regulator